MTHARTGSSFVRALEHQVSAMVAESSQEAMATILGLASHAQVSRRLDKVHAGLAHVESFAAVDLVFMARAHVGVRRALLASIADPERPVDGSRVTADLRALLSALTAEAAAEAAALEDGQVTDDELCARLHVLPEIRARLDRVEAAMLARLNARKQGAR